MKRDRQHAVIAGVCAGFAKTFDIDPLIIRLIFIVSFLAFGFGPLLYIILWLLTETDNNNTKQE